MNERHLTAVEMEKLLDSEDELFVSSAIGMHLKRCDACQQKLSEMAAQLEIWSKATQYLKKNDLAGSSPISYLGSPTDGEIRRILQNVSSESSHQHESWPFSPGDWLDPPKHPELLGSIGRYDIEREVGRGGMGVVYKAFDRELHRPLAIKVLAPHLAGQGTARKRFAQEAVAAAGIIHPNVIAVHGVNHQGRLPYIVMPFVDGISLQTLVDAEGPVAEIEITRITQQIAAGLSAAHSQGLVHRDVKPANILIEAGVNRVLITDFGLARVDDASMTQSGSLVGTLNYMSPEQARGQRADCRSDLFSLGSLMYFLASGRLPFRSDTSAGVINNILNETPTPVRQLNNQVSETFALLIERLLRKEPKERFQTSVKLHETLTQHLAFLHQPDVLQPPKIEPVPLADEATEGAPGSTTNLRWQTVLFGGIFVLIGGLALLYISDVANHFFTPATAKTELRNSSNFNFGNPKEGVLLIENGNNLLELDRYDQATEMYTEAQQFAWCTGPANFQLGCVWALKGEQKKAFQALHKALDHGFGELEAFRTERLNSIRNTQEFSKLISYATEIQQAAKTVEAKPGDCTLEELKQAEITFHEVLQRNADNEEAIVSLALLLHRQHRYSEAIKWHHQTSHTKKYSAIGHYNLACYYALHDQCNNALDSLEAAIDLGLSYLLDPETVEQDSDLNSIRSEKAISSCVQYFL